LKEYSDEARDFMGPVDLYRKSGFELYGETEDRFVMRRPVK